MRSPARLTTWHRNRSPASDIYALGTVLYEMLTGSHLFEADNYMGILVKQLYEQPRPPHELNPLITPELEAVVLRALEKDPTRHYQRPDELQQAVERAATLAGNATGRISSNPAVHLQQATHAAHSSPTQPDNPLLRSQTLPDASLSLPQPITQPTTRPFSARSQPPGARRSAMPLIVVLVLIILALAAGLSGVLYTQGLFGGRRVPATQGATAVVSTTGDKSGPTPSVVATIVPLTTTQTNCPATGQAHAAVMAQLVPGNRDSVVYIINEGTASNPTVATIMRHEIMPGLLTKTIEISKMPEAYISAAQLSQDGAWVLFVANIAGQSQLRLVRVDGQGLQTLYCAPAGQAISHIQWSFDQRTVVVNTGPTGSNQSATSTTGTPVYRVVVNTGPTGSNLGTTYLLDIISGDLQQELASPSNLFPQVWLDNTHVYMVGSVDGSNTQNIYLLDINKGAQQQTLQKIVTGTQNCGSFDSSYDSQLLLLSTCHLATPVGGGQSTPLGPTAITSQPALGGSAKTIQTLPQAVTMLRAVTNNTLLLLIENYSGDTSQNGLWEMNTDGTGLAQLSSDKNNTQSLCPFTQYAWSNVSRDNEYYALQEVDPKTNTYAMYYGSLGGGAPTQFNRVTGTQVLLVGWTGM